MSVLVQVSMVEHMDKLKTNIEEYYKQGKYEEITEAIGMHSIMISPRNTMEDQASLYHYVLGLIKDRIRKSKGAQYGAWYSTFPRLMDALITKKELVVDERALEEVSSHRDAFGEFRSVDAFYAWALDDRRLSLGQIVKYIEKTAEQFNG